MNKKVILIVSAFIAEINLQTHHISRYHEESLETGRTRILFHNIWKQVETKSIERYPIR